MIIEKRDLHYEIEAKFHTKIGSQFHSFSDFLEIDFLVVSDKGE